MAIASSDILNKLSVVTGSAGNSTASTPAGSLGKYISTTQITDATVHNLFDQVSGDENAASTVDYRCYFIHNNHASLTWESVVAWISSEVALGASIAIAVDTTAASAIGSAGAQALLIANEITAPSGVSWSTATTKATGVSIGNITAGQCRAIWVRRTAANSAAINTDGAVITCEGDTAP